MEDPLTCYMRHLHDLFDVLDLEYTAENREAVDGAIRDALDLADGESCPGVWSAIKELPPEERESLPAQVSERLAR